MTLFFEDIEVGETRTFGSYDVSEAEIVEFAERYDPQWFHTDPERAAEESIYGDVIASGWHTCAMTMRLLVDDFLADTASVGAKGLDELRWRRPVYPGDTLRVRTEVLDKTADRPDRGTVRVRSETLDGDDEDSEVVLTMVSLVMFARRGTDGTDEG